MAALALLVTLLGATYLYSDDFLILPGASIGSGATIGPSSLVMRARNSSGIRPA